MKLKNIAFVLVLVIISLIGIYSCAFLYPNLLIKENANLYWLLLSFHWLAALPCYGIVGIFSYLSYLFVKGKMYCSKSVKFIKACSIVMLCDTVFFLAVFIACLILSCLTEFYTHIVILLFGILISILLYILSKHVEKVSKDQDDLEGTI